MKKNRLKKAYNSIAKKPYVPIGKTAVEIYESYGGLTLDEAIILGIASKATGGDVSAASFIRDTLGEKLTDSKGERENLKISIVDV